MELDNALLFAHQEVHAGYPGLSIDECTCAMASEQRELALLLKEAEIQQQVLALLLAEEAAPQ